MKRICRIILSLIITITMLSPASTMTFAADVAVSLSDDGLTTGSCGENVTYTLDTYLGILTISGTGAMTDYSSSSYAPWYGARSSITTLEIKSGVTSIGNYAFYDCSGLTSITIPNNVTSIGDNAFRSCSRLINITLSNGVTSIGNSAFYYCTSLTSITIPSSVTSIGDGAFRSCNGLTSITVDSNNQNYSSQDRVLFNKNKTALVQYPKGFSSSSYTIPSSVTSIGDYAFDDCYGLTSITIPNSVTSIGNSAFYKCSGLTSITIPNSVTSIGNSAFEYCSKLTKINIPSSVTSIGNYAFEYCSKLTKINIPSSVTSIGNYAFYGCSGLISITVDSNNQNYSSQDGVLFNKNKTALIQYPKGITSTSYTIPSSVKSIGNSAFYKCNSLTNITIPSSVTSIGDSAFYECSGLTSITIPNGVTSIGDSVFYKCLELTYITIPSSVTSIGNYAFYNCSLTDITIPSSVTSIGNYAFYFCNSLTKITILNGVTSIGNSAFHHCSGLTSITIPNSVTSIGDSAFEYCSSLTSITIPSSVISIGDYAFTDCHSLTSITIPSSVTSIGNGAFKDCSGLTSITIPSSVTSIGNGAFSYCDSLTSITIPGSVTSIGNSAFEYCSKLTKINIPSSVTSIGNYAFGGCFGLTSITIPNGVTSIGNSAFRYCSGLTNITIPSSVTSIGNYAFSSCDGLTDVIIPSSVTSIGDGAFGGCSGLTSITVDSNNKNYTSQDGVLFNKNKTALVQYLKSNTRTSYTIPSSVTSIGNSAFYSCDGLTSITIPNSVTSIGDSAFEYCDGLTKITIPSSVTSIGDFAFHSCDGLTNITILNKDCTIFDSSYTIDSSTELIGYSGSTAQAYAEKHGRTFRDITTVEHTYTTEIVPPTCTEQGYTTYTCELCGYTYISDYVDITEHSYITKITQPTCTAQGYTTYTCKVCGETYVDDYTEIIPHNYILTVTEPTCTTQGYTTYTCQSCSHTYIGDYVNITEHNYIYTDIPMTETNFGYRVAKCELCGNKEYSNLSAPEIKIGETKQISFSKRNTFNNYEDQGLCYFQYTPDKDITVTFSSAGDIGVGGRVVYGFTGEDFEGVLCSDNYEHNNNSVNPIINEHNFSITCDLTAGETYGFTAIAGDQYTSGSYSVTLESDDANIISTDVQNITAGEQISIPIKISNNHGIMGFKFMFEYDASVLTPTSVTAGDLISTGLDNNLEGDAKPGAFNVYWYSTKNMYDDGTLFYLNFNVNKNAIGSTVINTLYSQDDTFSESSQGNIVDAKLICSPFELKIDNPNYQKYYISQLVSYDNDGDEISAVTGGDVFNIALRFVDGTNNGNDLTKAVFNIEYDNNNFEFVGFADETGKMLSYSSNNNDVKIQMNGATVYDYYNKSKDLCSIDKLRLVFKANELATEGSYVFNCSITDYEGVATADTTGLSLGLIASQASKNTTVKIDSGIIGQYGDTITVPVSISNNHGLMGYGLTLKYNPDELEFVSAKLSSLFGGSLYYNEDTSVGEIYVVWFANDETDANGIIFDLTFQVNTNNNVRSEIGISYNQDDTFNGNYEDVIMNCIGTAITLNSEERHLYEAIIVEPTCESEGYTEYVCTTCSDTYRDTYVPAKGHFYKCTDYNNKVFTYQCTDCNDQITKSASDVYALWDIKYVNNAPNRTVIDNSSFLDVVSDNIINAKDYAIIYKSKK